VRGYLRRVPNRGDYWELEVDAGRDPVSNKRRKVCRGFRGTKREAERELAELVNEVNRGKGRGTAATVGDLLERWLAAGVTKKGAPWSPTTRARAQEHVQTITPALGMTQLNRLDPSDIDALYVSLAGKGLAPRTIRGVHSVLHRSLDQAVRWGWIPGNPADRATPPGAPPQKIQPPDPQAVAKILTAAKEWHDGTLGTWLHLAITTGARRGELCGLRWEDVDLNGGSLLISRAVVSEDGTTLVVKGTKTHQARRLALDEGTVQALREHQARMNPLRDIGPALPTSPGLSPRLIAGAGARLTGYVFSDDLDGARPWRPDRVSLAFRRLCDREGVRIRLHDLRHFAVTRMLAGGVDVRTVAGRVGHANPAVTLSVYSHFVPENDRAAADLLGGLLT